jgi:hypothetical protein
LICAVSVVHQRCEKRHLSLGFEHRLVGAVKVVEMANQSLDTGAHIEGLQHVVAHEVSEVAHRLHRHRLVKQLQGLLVLDAKAPTEPRRIRRVAVEQFGPCLAQLFAQAGDVGTKAPEIFRDAQHPLGRHKQAGRLGLRVFEPEHLGQGDRLVVPLVAEHPQHHGIAAGITQGHRLGVASDLIAFALVMPKHIRAQIALAGLSTSSLVVGDPVRGHQ